ncbi:hypothetical protein BpHYR1_047569 [Brachionus plicatilis]|uniref:Uncharacterized protein n=1 Tax=Brachionus plicatilis TaxID=10195 RepID=A0A3M7SRG9_BRAPC|nr:hypothetical protein BpHYR1_047569 [Brachionus plicatilis]
MFFHLLLSIKTFYQISQFIIGKFLLESIFILESHPKLNPAQIECGMLQLSKLHQLYSKTSLRRWPTRRSPILQQANNLDLLRWETIFRTKKAVYHKGGHLSFKNSICSDLVDLMKKHQNRQTIFRLGELIVQKTREQELFLTD